MGMDTGGSGGGPSSEINVTPLVDVCLVLLIIFMVMTPKTVPEISVQVPPERKTRKPPPDQSDTLLLGLTADGAITLNHNPISSEEELGKLIESRLENREPTKKAVFIDFDDDANYGEAINLLDLAKRSGALVLAVRKRKDRKTPDTLTDM